MWAPILIAVAFAVAMVIIGTALAWADFQPLRRAHQNQGDIMSAYRQRHGLPQKDQS